MFRTFTEKRSEWKEQISEEIIPLIHRGMVNRKQWLLVNLKGRLWSGSLRDQFMFENIEWLRNYYKGEKLIVWAHNYHIRKNRSLLLELLRIKTVDHLLAKKYADRVFSVGFYAGSGTCLTPYKDLHEITMINQYHLELLLKELNGHTFFLPTNIGAKRNAWNKQAWWLLETRLLGMAPLVLKPIKAYDAIFFIKCVKPPQELGS